MPRLKHKAAVSKVDLDASTVLPTYIGISPDPRSLKTLDGAGAMSAGVGMTKSRLFE